MRRHYIEELEAVRQDLVEMGQTTISLLDEVSRAVADPDPGPSERASELEAQTDHQHRLIHDECLNLIALQAPVAGDARLITGILEAIVDLELIGDYGYEIVKLTGDLNHKPPSEVTAQVAETTEKVRHLLSSAVESWRNRDRAQALSLRPQAAPIRDECERLYSTLSQSVSAPENRAALVDLMLVCKHLERILRHTVSVAEQAAEAAPLSEAA